MGAGFVEFDNLATGEQSPQLHLSRRTTHLGDDWSGDGDGQTQLKPHTMLCPHSAVVALCCNESTRDEGTDRNLPRAPVSLRG